MKTTIVFFLCTLLLGGRVESFGKTRELEVDFVQNEVARGKTILATGDVQKILDDPYLVSALYYSASFFAKIRRGTTVSDPQDEVLLGLARSLTSTARERYIVALQNLAGDSSNLNLVAPLDHYVMVSCKACHPDAIDLFTEEGSVVRSMSQGVVVLAEEGWQANQQFATTSRKGGNEVIIFNSRTKRFYRYCHLGSLSVRVRDVVHPGQVIGTVGHTGLHASLPNRGRHLHLEINQYDSRTHSNRSILRLQLSHELARIQNK